MTVRTTYPTWGEAIRAIATYWNNAFAGNRMINGVDTTDDVIVDDNSKGLVLRSPDGDYWRISIDNAGTISGTNLGTTKP